MDIIAIGLSHSTASIDVREQLAVRTDRLPEFLPQLKAATGLQEAVALSTCNRFEVYGATPHAGTIAPRIVRFLSYYHHLPVDQLDARLYRRAAPDSVGHLYRVASGLDSMILGENEILGQVKQAYGSAKACGATSKYLNRLFETAINAAKAVRTETDIARGSLSVGSVAISLAAKIFSRGLGGRSVMLLGSGKVAELTLQHLRDAGASSVVVSSRRPERARALADGCGAGWATLDEAWTGMQQTDIVLVSTAAPRYLIDADRLRHVMVHRRQRPLFLIDLSVPRNVDPSVGRLDNVYLYNIDDLQRIVAANAVERRSELAQCLELVEYKVGLFMQWLGREAVRAGA